MTNAGARVRSSRAIVGALAVLLALACYEQSLRWLRLLIAGPYNPGFVGFHHGLDAVTYS